MTPDQRRLAKNNRRAHRASKDPKANKAPPKTSPASVQTAPAGRLGGASPRGREAYIDHLRSLDLRTWPDMDEQMRLIRELMALGRERVLSDHDRDVPYHERSSFLHPEVQAKARAICERLYEITKDKDPGFFRWLFECDMLSFPPIDRRELSVVLDGIGDWRD